MRRYLLIIIGVLCYPAVVCAIEYDLSPSISLSSMVGTDELLAVSNTYRDFLGENSSDSVDSVPIFGGIGGGGSGSGGSVTDEGEAENHTPKTPVNRVRDRYAQTLTLRLSDTTQVSGVSSYAELSVEHSRSLYSLPKGVGVFKDPIRLSIRSLRSEVALGVRASVSALRMSPYAEVELLQSFQRLWVNIDSDLLRVRGRDWVDDQGFAIELGLDDQLADVVSVYVRAESYLSGLERISAGAKFRF